MPCVRGGATARAAAADAQNEIPPKTGCAASVLASPLAAWGEARVSVSGREPRKTEGRKRQPPALCDFALLEFDKNWVSAIFESHAAPFCSVHLRFTSGDSYLFEENVCP